MNNEDFKKLIRENLEEIKYGTGKEEIQEEGIASFFKQMMGALPNSKDATALSFDSPLGEYITTYLSKVIKSSKYGANASDASIEEIAKTIHLRLLATIKDRPNLSTAEIKIILDNHIKAYLSPEDGGGKKGTEKEKKSDTDLSPEDGGDKKGEDEEKKGDTDPSPENGDGEEGDSPTEDLGEPATYLKKLATLKFGRIQKKAQKS